MTNRKEEILNEVYIDSVSNKVGSGEGRLKHYNEAEVKRAMDQYAKEVAIGFAKWTSNGSFKFNHGEFSKYGLHYYATEALFDQFIKEKQNDTTKFTTNQ